MNADDVFRYGHLTVLGAVEGFPPEQWETPGVCGVWSVKDVIAHLAAYERMLQEVLAPFAGVTLDKPTLTQIGEIGPAAWNDIAVEARRGQSNAQTLAEYRDTFTYIQTQLVPLVAAETWSKVGTLPWYGPEYSLDDYIVYSFYGHKREHGAQVAAFKDRL